MADEYRRIINFVEDIRKLQVPKIERIEKVVRRTKTAAYTGLGLGIVGVALGGFVVWTLWDRGWW